MTPRGWMIPVGFLAYGLAIGLLTISWMAPGRDAPFPLNLPGFLLGQEVYPWAIRLFGDPGSPQAHYTIPWLLRIPQVIVLASAVLWGLIGVLVWGGSKVSGVGIGRVTEVALALLAIGNIAVLSAFVGVGVAQPVKVTWLLLGVAGLLGVAMDSERRSPRWGLVTWVSAVGLILLTIPEQVGVWLYMAPTLLAFSLAALLADRRRGRAGLATRAFAAGVGLVALVILVFLIVIALPWPAWG